MTFSVLSEDADWRLSSMFGLPPMLFDLKNDSTGAVNIAGDHLGRTSEMSNYYWRSHWNKSKLKVRKYKGEEESISYYDGFDMMRTPYAFGFSIGLEIPPLKIKSNSRVKLAEQEGVWQLTYLSGEGLEWKIGGAVLKGLSFNPSECNSIVLTGDLQPEHDVIFTEAKPTKEVKLYISGLLQESIIDINYPLPSDLSLQVPTKVFYGGKAIFSNMALSSFSDSYSPKVPLEHYQTFQDQHKLKKLTISEVSMLDSELCVGQ
jgi:hypothetical protein